MKSKKQFKPTNRQLSRDIGFLVKEVMMVKDYIKDVVSPTLQSTMAMFESYLKFKGETEELIKFMEKEIDNVKQNVDEESKKREKKQTKRSRTAKTSS
jgi:hypothetical protein